MFSWKDTILTDEQIWDIIRKVRLSPREAITIQDGRAVAAAQAEVSFKAGKAEGRLAARNEVYQELRAIDVKAFDTRTFAISVTAYIARLREEL